MAHHREQAMAQFRDALAVFDLRPGDQQSLITAATACLAAGIDGPAMLALAAVPVRPPMNPLEFDELLSAVRAEHRLPLLDVDARQLRAAQAFARRWRSGALSDARFAGWLRLGTGLDADGLAGLSCLDDRAFARVIAEGLDPDQLRERSVELLEQGDVWASDPDQC